MQNTDSSAAATTTAKPKKPKFRDEYTEARSAEAKIKASRQRTAEKLANFPKSVEDEGAAEIAKILSGYSGPALKLLLGKDAITEAEVEAALKLAAGDTAAETTSSNESESE